MHTRVRGAHEVRLTARALMRPTGVSQPAQAPRPDISKARKVSPNLDYSKVVQNKIPKEHVSPSTSNPNYDRPLKDASINAGLLKDLFKVIEEEPSIDKQTFAGRLKLPFYAPFGICGRR
ncbi:hypothetical protein TNCV_1194401 [Trichonephila clavipes]|nr:hypothetical protein TNCV_1194401 [Trichonephila clavipes]